MYLMCKEAMPASVCLLQEIPLADKNEAWPEALSHGRMLGT